MKTTMTMTMKTIVFLCLILIASILVFFVYKQKESFSNNCPTTLIKDGEGFLVYNPGLAKIPGVNPIKMNSLEDYEKYVKWQRSQNLDCPVLKLEEVINNYNIDSYSGTSGVLNHKLAFTDSNMKTESCLGNIKLGQNLNSNYEYNYYTSSLNDKHNLSMLPSGPIALNSPTSTYASSMKPGSYGNSGSQYIGPLSDTNKTVNTENGLETGLPLITGPNIYSGQTASSGPQTLGYTGTSGIVNAASLVGATVTTGLTGMGITGSSSLTGIETMGLTGMASSNITGASNLAGMGSSSLTGMESSNLTGASSLTGMESMGLSGSNSLTGVSGPSNMLTNMI
jgi:hypothetical protein